MRVEGHEPLALLVIRLCGDHRGVLPQNGVDSLLQLDMGNHLAADLAEAGEAVRDTDEAVLIDGGDISGDIPAVSHDLRRLFGLAKIAEHPIGAFAQEQSLFPGWEGLTGFGIYRPYRDAWQGMPHRPSLEARLAVSAPLEILRVHGNHGCQLGASVSLQEVQTVLLLQRPRDGFAQLFGAGNGNPGRANPSAEHFRR